MKKVIISIILCISCFFGVGCSLTLTNESLEESLIESIEQDEVIAQKPVEPKYVYTPLDETVKADIEAYLGKEFRYGCYYGEHEGKHVFYTLTFLAAVDNLKIGCFRLHNFNVQALMVWDGKELVEYWDECDIFSFEASRDIAAIHCNHMINRCWGNCAFEDNVATKQSYNLFRWSYMIGGNDYDNPVMKIRLGEYEMMGFFAEQAPLLTGNIGISALDFGLLPGEMKKKTRIVVAIENALGFDEKFSCYGTVADVFEMYQITEDMWLDSYKGFNQSEGFDLEKAKSIKYCVPINLSLPIEGCAELCLVLDNDKDKNTYILVMNVDEETDEKYISQIYQYQWVREQQE